VSMSDRKKIESLSQALTAALLRLGVGTAVFDSSELVVPFKLRCRRQADGSLAVSLETPAK